MMHNEEQIAYWNGEGGERWAQRDATMARILRPVAEALIEHAAVQDCQRVLDIGCGGGSQSLLLADQLAPTARVLGVDISAPLLTVAQQKAATPRPEKAQLDFMQADASTYAFAANSFDLLFSRFGVMFFDEPAAAFTHLRRALRPDGRLAFCCWQPLRDNDWTYIPLQTALKFVAEPEPTPPRAPGPFAFADPDYVREILHSAGFDQVQLASHRTSIRFGESESLSDSVRETATLGPASGLLTGLEPNLLEQIFEALEQVLAPHFVDGALNLPGAVWFVTARNTGES